MHYIFFLSFCCSWFLSSLFLDYLWYYNSLRRFLLRDAVLSWSEEFNIYISCAGYFYLIFFFITSCLIFWFMKTRIMSLDWFFFSILLLHKSIKIHQIGRSVFKAHSRQIERQHKNCPNKLILHFIVPVLWMPCLATLTLESQMLPCTLTLLQGQIDLLTVISCSEAVVVITNYKVRANLIETIYFNYFVNDHQFKKLTGLGKRII